MKSIMMVQSKSLDNFLRTMPNNMKHGLLEATCCHTAKHTLYCQHNWVTKQVTSTKVNCTHHNCVIILLRSWNM